MDAETAGMACDDAVEACVERSYPQFDCVSSYVWIWGRLVQVAGRTEVGARHIRRDPREAPAGRAGISNGLAGR